MSLIEQLGSLKYIRCNLGSHSIKNEDISRLRESVQNKIDAKCSRCEMPLLLIRNEEKNRFSIIEK